MDAKLPADPPNNARPIRSLPATQDELLQFFELNSDRVEYSIGRLAVDIGCQHPESLECLLIVLDRLANLLMVPATNEFKVILNYGRLVGSLFFRNVTYPTFWRWSGYAVDHAMLHGWLWAVFGWRVHVGPEANPRSLANFPMQANGAEMLRLACCLATERGIRVCAPVHDAILIEAPADEIERAVVDCQAAMREASEVVLTGFPLRTEAKIVHHPERYSDPRGESMWAKIKIAALEPDVAACVVRYAARLAADRRLAKMTASLPRRKQHGDIDNSCQSEIYY